MSDTDAMQGGPLDGVQPEAGAEPFNSPDAGEQSPQEVYQQYQQQQAPQQQWSQPAQPAQQYQQYQQHEPEVDYEDLMFSNPKQFIQKLRSDVRNELTTEFSRRDEESKFWGEFYGENPDLKKHKRLVDLLVKDKRQHLESLYGQGKVAEAKKLLVDEARGIMGGVKDASVARTELQSGQATSLGSSQTQSQPKTPEQPAMSFIDQVKALKKRT